MIENITFTKFSNAQTMRIQINFRKNLEIDKNREKCLNSNFQKKGRRHKTQKTSSFIIDEKYSVHNGNIYQCAKSGRQENKNGAFVSHLW